MTTYNFYNSSALFYQNPPDLEWNFIFYNLSETYYILYLDRFDCTIVQLKLLLFVTWQIHLHAGNDAPLNVTFLRAPPSAFLKIDVPLVFRGEDSSPGLKKGISLLALFPSFPLSKPSSLSRKKK